MHRWPHLTVPLLTVDFSTPLKKSSVESDALCMTWNLRVAIVCMECLNLFAFNFLST